MREVLPLMSLIEEMLERGIQARLKLCKVHCNVFDGNEGSIEIAKVPKLRLRSKHLNSGRHVDKNPKRNYLCETQKEHSGMVDKHL